MATGATATARRSEDAHYLALSERVSNIKEEMDGVRRDVTSLGQSVRHELTAMSARQDAAIAGMSAKTDSAFATLAAKFDDRSRTPWGVIWTAVGVGVTMMAFIGGMALWPIRSDMTRLDQTMATKDQLGFIAAVVTEQQKNIVTREEHAALSKEREALLAIQAQRIDQMRDEIEDLKADNKSTYSLRDIILKLEREVDELRNGRRSGAPG